MLKDSRKHVIRHMLKYVLGLMSVHVPSYMLNRVRYRHAAEYMLKHELRDMSDKHVPRHVPKHRMVKAVPMI